VNFARTGDPNVTADPKATAAPAWPVYDASRDIVLELGDEVRVQSHINAAGLDFFDTFNRSLRPPPPTAKAKP
jgi:hypothetical protein